MKCPECNGRGVAFYYVETDRDENSVTVEQRKDICRTCSGSGKKPMTNAERIRAVSEDELAEDYCKFLNAMLSKVASKYKLDFEYDMEKGKSIMLKHLQQPAEGE